MDAGLQDYFRERLHRDREELKRRIAGIEDEGLALPMRDAIGELSLYDNHPADVASELFERSKDLSLKEDAALKLRAIEDALAKMAAGRYGFCDACGAPIPLERLEAVPYTTMCASCKEKQESQGGLRRRPVEEELLKHPWARPGDESVIYDREDAWQDVAQHGLSTETEPLEEENRGSVTDVDDLAYYKSNGAYYQNFRLYRGKPRGGR